MFNILTDNFKQHIQSIYKKRRVIVWLLAVIFLQVSFLIFILPSYLSLTSEEADLRASIQPKASTDQGIDNTQISQTFQIARDELLVLSSTENSHTLDMYVSRLISLKTSDIQLKEIMYQSQTATTSMMTVQGVAGTREALLSFSKNIEADNMFSNVDLPVSNFAKDKNIDFSMSMTAEI